MSADDPCSKCGAEVKPGRKVCLRCGTKVLAEPRPVSRPNDAGRYDGVKLCRGWR